MTRSTDNKLQDILRVPLKGNAEPESSGSCCSPSCCSDKPKDVETRKDPDGIPGQASITIDGQTVEIAPGDRNIVDLADRAGIGIPAPCYRARQSKGCCNSCVVDVDGEQKFACSTIPEKGMKVVVDRDDLKAIRKQRLLEYKKGIKSGNPVGCSTSDSSDCSC